MKKLLTAAAVSLSLAVPSMALACDGMIKADHATPSVKKVSVEQLANLNRSQKAVVFDANGTEFRAKNGIIPGAKLLSSSGTYDPARELPVSKAEKLVFYCANERCSASHTAAQRAVSAGYQDVSVLPDGLMGWKQSGNPTAPIPRS